MVQMNAHFTYGKLLKFVFPSIIMMIFTSVYGVVDGIFVSNFVGGTPFAALNFIMPFVMLFGAIGFMLGTGGSALVAKTMGEGNEKRANEYFSMIIWVTVILGVIISVVGMIIIRPVALFLGASEIIIDDAVLYGRILLGFQTAFMLQNCFQSFFVTAAKPQLGLLVTVGAGVTNMVLDFLFIVAFDWGLVGAALATGMSYVVGGIIPIFYFLGKKNTSLLRLTKTRFFGKALLKSCTNGSSELLTNVSMALVGMLYNFQLMRFAAEDGVSAYGVIMYVNFIFVSCFLGYSIGSAPLVGYNYGAQNHKELKSLLKKSLVIIGIGSVLMTAIGELLALPLSKIFVSYNPELMAMTCRGFRIYVIAFLFSGIGIFGSAFFTALNNGVVSALISSLRTLVFQLLALLILPEIWGLDGIWSAIIVSDLAAAIITAIFIVALRKRYHY